MSPPARRKKLLAAALAAVAHHAAAPGPTADPRGAPTRWKLSGLLELMRRPEPLSRRAWPR